MIVEQTVASPTERAAPIGSLERRATIHAALADPHRLAIVDDLALSDRSPSEIQDQLGMGSNLLAHHLDVLEAAGLIQRLGSGGDRRRKYLRLVPEALSAALAPSRIWAAERLLFVCTANSARSQLAEALWNARHEVPAESAGVRPAPRVHPDAVRAAERADLDLSGARPRSLEEVVGEPDLTITVCDRAHEYLRRTAPSRSHLHWSIPDPVDGDSPSSFDDAVHRLSAMIDSLAPRVTRAQRAGLRPRARRTRP
ncbi:MAG: helix-turn-helix domain-containing protein [Actinomycetota bacterium]